MTRRLRYLSMTTTERLVTEDCIHCGEIFAISEELYEKRHADKKPFWCPKCGKSMVYQGKTETQKLREERDALQAREVALNDQLRAALHEGELTRQQLLRDRQRFASGVCPCCNRSFENVRRHMETKHPDYDATKLHSRKALQFECSCGKAFDTLRGLRTHQGHMRPDDWASRGLKKDFWNQHQAHLTVTGAR